VLDLDERVPAIALGDAGAFAWWLARAEPALRRSLASFAARVDVEAVLQETLLRVWQVAPRVKVDGMPNALLRLARRIAYNLAVDAARRGAHEALDEGVDDASREVAVDPIEPDPFLREAVEGCRAGLPERPRLALDARLASHGGRPDRALADALGMRLNTFLQNVTRARELLAECLARRGIRLEAVWR
jgi:RNA polymerase sigma-70 factor (ECF subfamily)